MMYLSVIFCGRCFFFQFSCQIECVVKSHQKCILHDANKKIEINLKVSVFLKKNISWNADHDDFDLMSSKT